MMQIPRFATSWRCSLPLPPFCKLKDSLPEFQRPRANQVKPLMCCAQDLMLQAQPGAQKTFYIIKYYMFWLVCVFKSVGFQKMP